MEDPIPLSDMEVCEVSSGKDNTESDTSALKKKQYILCGALLAMLIILAIATGVLIIRTEAESDELRAKIKSLEGTVNQEIDARISKLEINTTTEHATEMAANVANQQRISKLESTNNDTMSLYEDIDFRLNYLEDGLNCSWGNWSSFSPCTASCGAGIQYRERSCVGLDQNTSEHWFSRKQTAFQTCNIGSCGQVNGAWTGWSLWSGCSASCGPGGMIRQRYCGNPPPANGGRSCSGAAIEQKSCEVMVCPAFSKVDGGWSSWSSWTSCTRTCDGGEKTRHRNCNKPAPAGFGRSCIGNSDEISVCNGKSCAVDGGWTSWSRWTSCTRTCDGGEKTRHRDCNNPAPDGLGRSCIGHSDETSICNNKPCSDKLVGFLAYSRKGYTSGKLTFNNVVHNYGNGFNAATGVFTAPVSGLYIVSMTIQVERDDHFICYMYKSGSGTGFEVDINGEGQEPATQTGVLKLTIGDTLYIGGSACTSSNVGDETTFSAGLIQYG